MPGILFINDIKLYAYHGCLPEETRIGGHYKIDLELTADLDEAAQKDDLSLTVDYCHVYEIVKREMEKPSRLIEHVARRIVLALRKEISQIRFVTVTLTKIAPPVNGNLGSAAVKFSG